MIHLWTVPPKLFKGTIADDNDPKYKGKPVSRGDIFNDNSDDDEDDIKISEDSEEDDDLDFEEQNADSDGELDPSGKGDELSDSEAAAQIATFSATSQQSELNKSSAVKNQLAIWDSLLESRIRLQRLMSLANRLVVIKRRKGTKLIKEDMKPVRRKLNALSNLIMGLLESLDVMSSGEIGIPGDQSGGGDEEITSEDEVDEDDGRDIKKPAAVKRKRKLPDDDIESVASKKHKDNFPLWVASLGQWNDRTRIGSKDQSLHSSMQSLIENALLDRERLIKRTQLDRNATADTIEKEHEEEGATANEEEDECCEDIFDDTDFYQQLLRELIERKTSTISDPLLLSKQLAEMEKLRGKIKRKVDTRASKGRKVRYDVHSKLVNFMAPAHQISWSDVAMDELFSSLFGGQKPVKEGDERGPSQEDDDRRHDDGELDDEEEGANDIRIF